MSIASIAPGVSSLSEREQQAVQAAAVWLLDLQNRDGGWPTFCRGWGTLPFDRSSSDLTAHTLRALHAWKCRVDSISPELRRRTDTATEKAIAFLKRKQSADGTWLPLWFGNQWNENDENPLYGTAKVVLAMRETGHGDESWVSRGIDWLLKNQNTDGTWSAARGLPGSVEETSLAVEALAGIPAAEPAVKSAADWLSVRIHDGGVSEASPIGFYFAKLWYFERLYPIIFAASALRRAAQAAASSRSS